MDETAYHQKLDTLMTNLEASLDQAETDLDYVNNAGLLTITCESGVQLVLSRQAPLQQLWLASPKGGMRFIYSANTAKWVLENDQTMTLENQLMHLLQVYAEESIVFDF